MFKKLLDIDRNSNKTFIKSPFILRKNPREAYVKNEIKTLAQDNLFMLKKLITLESEYKHDKFEKKYKE